MKLKNKVTKQAKKEGEVYIFKNNKPRYKLIDLEKDTTVEMKKRKKKTVIKFFDVVNEKEDASTPSYHLLLFQELTKLFHSTSTVANGILDIIT